MINEGPEPVILHIEVLGRWGDLLIDCEHVDRLIVLKQFAVKLRPLVDWQFEELQSSHHSGSQGNESSDGLYQSNILTVRGGQADLGNQLRLPYQWHTTKSNDKSIPGLDRVGVH